MTLPPVLRTYRVGRPNGIFYGTHIEGPDRKSADLPTTGPHVRVIEGTDNDGDGSGAPVADAVTDGLISLPIYIIKLLREHDVSDLTCDLDLAGIIALKHKGLEIVHFPSRRWTGKRRPVVSLDLKHADIRQLNAEFGANLLPRGEGDYVFDPGRPSRFRVEALFDSTLPYVVANNGTSTFGAIFSQGSVNYVMELQRLGPRNRSWELSFRTVEPDFTSRDDLLGGQNAVVIFSTLIRFCQEFLSVRGGEADKIVFRGRLTEPSRIKFYRKWARVLADRIEFPVVREKSYDAYLWFTLSRRSKTVKPEHPKVQVNTVSDMNLTKANQYHWSSERDGLPPLSIAKDRLYHYLKSTLDPSSIEHGAPSVFGLLITETGRIVDCGREEHWYVIKQLLNTRLGDRYELLQRAFDLGWIRVLVEYPEAMYVELKIPSSAAIRSLKHEVINKYPVKTYWFDDQARLVNNFHTDDLKEFERYLVQKVQGFMREKAERDRLNKHEDESREDEGHEDA